MHAVLCIESTTQRYMSFTLFMNLHTNLITLRCDF